MSLASCRSAIAAVLTEKLPTVHVSEHGGPFNLEELDRVAKKLPAAVVVCLNARGGDYGSVLTLDAQWAVFCVVKNETGEGLKNKRDVAGLLLAEAVASVVMRDRWNVDVLDEEGQLVPKPQASGVAKNLDINNLFSGAIDKRGVALLAVRWRQQVDLIGPEVVNTLDAFETFFGTYDVGETATTPVTEQQVELEQ